MPSFDTPFGILYCAASSKGLTYLYWQNNGNSAENAHTRQAQQQIQEFFNHNRTTFDIPLDLQGTPFQKQVWAEIAKIPYGKTVSYSDIAQKINSHPRAVGMATGKNPVPILIPCHRVMGKNGTLTGFSGGDGIPTKEKLLHFEGTL